MTPLWTAAEAARATGGAHRRDWEAHGVSIDTRTLCPGDLFVALSDRRDGHDFVGQALARGAAAALVSRLPEGVDPEAPLLVVDDVLGALRAMGEHARARTGAKIVAVTGSVGKTSAKEMLRAVLAPQGRTHAAEASFNNHWGVPLTLARMPADSDFAVLEIGMNHPGEIAPLAALARPDVALVTNVAAVHLEAFDDVDAIAREKAALFAALGAGGTAVVNLDLPTTQILLDAARAASDRVVGFGRAETAEWRLLEVTHRPDSTVAQAVVRGQKLLFKVMSPGAHVATNALGVLAAAEAAGADIALAACDIATWTPPPGRGTRETVALDPGDLARSIELIDDAFNANPTSLAAALDTLAARQPAEGVGRNGRVRRIAILGDMLELGPDEIAMHAAIGDLEALQAVDLVHCVGPRMKHLWERLPETRRGHWVAEAASLAERAASLVDAGDIVLVKGSKSIRVSLVVDAIRELGHRDGRSGPPSSRAPDRRPDRAPGHGG